MAAHGGLRHRISRASRPYLDRAAINKEQEMMCGSVLVEAHRGGATRFELRLLHLREMLVMAHAGGHRRMLRTDRVHQECQEPERDEGQTVFSHDAMLDPGVDSMVKRRDEIWCGEK
jgi:hypothetical protein